MRAAPVRIVATVLLGLYGFVVARLTLLPADTETTTIGTVYEVITRLSHGRLQWTQFEAVANVALFVPAGFLLAVVLRRSWAAAIGCVLASAAIEGAQYAFLASRVPSLADVEHNSLGGLIGAVLAWPLVSWLRRRSAADQPVIPVSEPSRAR